jgi:hypothetical protein
VTAGSREVDDDLVIDGLAERWAGYYRLIIADGEYHAYRLVPLTAPTPAALDSVIRADWNRWSKQ